MRREQDLCKARRKIVLRVLQYAIDVKSSVRYSDKIPVDVAAYFVCLEKALSRHNVKICIEAGLRSRDKEMLKMHLLVDAVPHSATRADGRKRLLIWNRDREREGSIPMDGIWRGGGKGGIFP